MKVPFLWLVCLLPVATLAAGDLDSLPGRTYPAADSLDVGEEASEDARECLRGLSWSPGEFDVHCRGPRPEGGDLLIRFPSPVVSGDEVNDLVAMEWFLARNGNGEPIEAPAVVVVHESGRRMPVGRLFARGLRQRGMHTFLIHLPYYGERTVDGRRPGGTDLLTLIRQAVADVRRARDAVAVLPWIDPENVSLQGTSLGGFVAATVAGVDRGYSATFVMLAGGDVYQLLQKGQKDAARVRRELENAGLTDETLRELARAIEPNRLAHRIDAPRLWLYSGDHDTVVPIENALSFAKAAGLKPEQHVRMPANHYSGILFLPVIQDHIAEQIHKGGTCEGAGGAASPPAGRIDVDCCFLFPGLPFPVRVIAFRPVSSFADQPPASAPMLQKMP